MTRITYNFSKEPRNQEYYNLLDYALVDCKYVLLVIRDTMQLSSEGTEIQKKLSIFLYKTEQTSEWPGTTLINSKATVFKYHFSEESAAVLKESAPGLYQWQQPMLPEDLCLLRADESPWLISIGHEEDSFLLLSDAEVYRLLEEKPTFQSILLRKQEK